MVGGWVLVLGGREEGGVTEWKHRVREKFSDVVVITS